jgi:hypothetical protein
MWRLDLEWSDILGERDRWTDGCREPDAHIYKKMKQECDQIDWLGIQNPCCKATHELEHRL